MTLTSEPTAAPDIPSDDVPGNNVKVVLAAVAATLLLASLGQTIVSTALPVIVADLGGLDHLTWVITAYLLASTVGAPIFGKLGDLFGRKPVMQGGIGVFLVGSVLAGLAQSMNVLIVARAIQGFGAGGLIVVSMAVVGDILPARDRGKAQGVLGAAFGLSTVIGPLVGGYLVETLGWHSIFFVNLPFALIALLVIARALHANPGRQKVRIDYLGAALLAAFLASAVLLTNLGGSALPWGSAGFLGLLALAVLLLMAFVWTESRAADPILPLALFRNNTFLVVNGVGFFVGMAMFGAITFLPLFLQIVKKVSPTASGLFLLPMMGGLLLASIGAGQVMSRTGRYKLLPILSTGLLCLAMISLTTLAADTALWSVALSMACVGLGLGPVFSVGVAAIQNAIPVSMMGVGTASANMFRLIGGSIGTSAFGAIFASGLAARLAGALPGDSVSLGGLSAEAVSKMPEGTQDQVLAGFSAALHPIFVAAAVIAATACLLSMLLRELPLATRLPDRA